MDCDLRVSRRRRRNKSSITFNWDRAVREEAFLFKTTVNSFQLGGTVNSLLPTDLVLWCPKLRWNRFLLYYRLVTDNKKKV